MKKIFIKILLFTFIFSNIVPHIAEAQSFENDNKQTDNKMITVDEKVDYSLTEELEDKVETKSYISSKDEIVVSNNIDTRDVKVDSKINLGIGENSTVLTTIEETDTGEIINYNFNVEITSINGDDFTAVFTDLDNGEQYNVNTAEVQASWYPLVVIAIHVARHGIKWAIKKHGKKAVSKATKKYGKKASGKTLSKLKFVNTKKFNKSWGDHKKEFPGITKSGYLKRAQSLAGSTSKNVLTKKVKKKGKEERILKYNRKTNELVVLTKDDKIITFFKPKYPNKKAGRKYFDNQ